MATTSTPTCNKVIVQKLCIEKDKCATIEKLSNKLNIKFVVEMAPNSTELMLLPLVKEIQYQGKATYEEDNNFFAKLILI